MLSGSPLLFLDMRKRLLVEAQDRQALIEAAKREFDKHCDALLEKGVTESFDCMTIAYFHEVLFGDGNPMTTETHFKGTVEHAKEPLYAAIEHAQEGKSTAFKGTLAPATVEQIHDLCVWIARRFASDAWTVLPDTIKKDAASQGEGTYDEYYKRRIAAFSTQARMILSDSNFHRLNIWDTDGAPKLVGELVKLDRLPKETTLQGLLLLRSAWSEHDIAVYLAGNFKFRSKIIFLFQLALAWSMVVVGILRSDSTLSSDSRQVMAHVLFGLATSITMVTSLDAFFNSKTRWRQLRSCACALESMIWCYRARIGRFQQSGDSSGTRPESEFCEALNGWRMELVSAADLQSTDLDKIYKPHVYKHQQWKEVGGIETEHNLADDHHSPVKPDNYIATRIRTMMIFYQERLPIYNRTAFLLRMAIVTTTATSTVLSYLEYSNYVVLVTAFGSAVVSWTEFAETTRKIERYERAIRAIKMLLSWWDVLSDVEKAGAENISILVQTGEAIIGDERQAWQSTTNRLGTNRGNEGQGKEQSAKAKNKVADDWAATA